MSVQRQQGEVPPDVKRMPGVSTLQEASSVTAWMATQGWTAPANVSQAS